MVGALAVRDLILLALAIGATIVDLRERRVPNRLLLVGAVLLLLDAALGGFLVSSAIGGAVLGVFGGLLALVGSLGRLGGLGMGDVKYLAVIGLGLGLSKGVEAFVVAAVVGGGVALALMLSRRARASDMMPYAPFLALGSLVALLLPGR